MMIRRLLLLLTALSLPTWAQWDKGFNFRATSGYVTDGAGQTYSIGAAYPETRNSVTFGWSADISSGGTNQCRDRNNGIDARLAGMCFDSQNQVVYFRVDLPSTGQYTIHLALGDNVNPQTHRVTIRDTTTTLATISGSSSSNFYLDATGASYDNVGWPTMETGVTFTFSTTQLRIYIGDGTNNTTLAHLRVVQASTARPIRRVIVLQ